MEGTGVDREQDADGHRFVGRAVVVEIVLELVLPLRDGGERRAGDALGVVHKLAHQGRSTTSSVSPDYFLQPGLSRALSSDLGVEVSPAFMGCAHVAEEQVQNGAI